MFPTVGLYLPSTVQGNMHARPQRSPPESRPESQQSSKRNLLTSPSIDRISLARKSSEDVSRRSEDINRSNPFASTSTAFWFADFVSGLKDASSEVQSFARVIQRVRADIYRGLWLRASPEVGSHCEHSPENRLWIDNILLDVQVALNDIGAFVENARGMSIDDEVTTVKLRHKFEWVILVSNQQKVRDRQNTLLFCHQSLSTAINFMQMVQMSSPIQPVEAEAEGVPEMMYESPATPWMQQEEGNTEVMRSPNLRHKLMHKLSQGTLSTPSITVSQYEETEVDAKEARHISSDPNSFTVRSVNSEPVELPGSTPDDLPDPNNWDLRKLASQTQKTITESISLPAVSEMLRAAKIATKDEESVSSPTTAHNNDVPQLAKRYRARRVNVTGPNSRHRSLPTKLPFIAQTPSLVTELGQWVENYDLESTGNHGTVKTDTKTVDTPSTSSASSPTSATSCPARMRSFSSTTSHASSNMSPRLPPANFSSSLKRKPLSLKMYRDSRISLREEPTSSSAVEEIGCEKTVEVSETTEGPTFRQEGCEKTVEDSGITQAPASGQTASPEIHTEQSEKPIDPVSTETVAVPSPLKVPQTEENEKLPTSAPTGPNTIDNEPLPPVSEPDVPCEEPLPLLSRPIQVVQNTPSSSSSQSEVQFISPLAKRRRAHQRRMQAIYDRDSD